MSLSLAEQPLVDTPTGPDAEPDPRLTHTWVGAATIALDFDRARYVNFRQSFRTRRDERLKIDVLEVYCSSCRRTWDQVGDGPCAATINNEHLIGGNPGERAKRKSFAMPAGARSVPAPSINRRGLRAVLSGEA